MTNKKEPYRYSKQGDIVLFIINKGYQIPNHKFRFLESELGYVLVYVNVLLFYFIKGNDRIFRLSVV